MNYLFCDTETTGVPRNYNAPVTDTNNWPHLVQLGWIVTDEYGNIQIHHQLPIDSSKNVLICNVKRDNWEQYLDGSAKIYYTGKKFPTTVALNKLYYFMPYISGKGIRDLYYIKIARLGYRKEGQEEENKSDLRLVFEIERVGQLFDDYKKVKLEIWRTFTDTTIKSILTK